MVSMSVSITAIATIAEKVNEDRGDLRLTLRIRSRAAVNHRFLLEGWLFFYLMGVSSRKRRRERQRFWVRKERNFWYFAVGNAVHPGILCCRFYCDKTSVENLLRTQRERQLQCCRVIGMSRAVPKMLQIF